VRRDQLRIGDDAHAVTPAGSARAPRGAGGSAARFPRASTVRYDAAHPDCAIVRSVEPEESAQLILQHLEERGLIPAGVTA